MASAYALPGIEKLKGRENYDCWKFAVKSYLEHEDLWACVLGTETDAKKITKARTKITLLVESVNYVHVEGAQTAKEAWDNLAAAFTDSGLTRKVGLLRQLITTKLEDTSSIEEYVNKIISTSQKLKSINMDINDEWIGTILLAGLPDEYKPMIMGLESSGINITADAIKAKLLQDVKYNVKEESRALYVKNNVKSESNDLYTTENRFNTNKPQTNHQKKVNLKNIRCFSCNKYGHYANNCKNKKNSVALFSAFSTNYGEGIKSTDWFLDSAASAHMTSDESLFIDINDIAPRNISTADHHYMKSTKSGNISLCLSKRNNIELKNVLLVPELKVNLVSVPEIVKKGHTVNFDDKGFKILHKNRIIASGSFVNGLFKFNVEISKKEKAFNVYSKDKDSRFLWHRRLGHVSENSLNKLKSGLVLGINFNDEEFSCEACIKGKAHRLPFPISESKSKAVLELIHTDLCGPFETRSFSDARYLLSFLDDYSHMMFVYPLKSKDQVYDYFTKFKLLVENQTDSKIKIMRSDNGTEYCNTKFKNYLESCGIQHQLTVPYSPEQNGKAERLNRSVVEKTRCMLIDSGLPKIFWAEAANTAVYLLNRSPTRCLNNKTPFEMWFGCKPNLEHLKVFGCTAYAHVPKEKRAKLDPKATESVMIGYDDNSKAYRLYNKVKNNVFVCRDVIFNERAKNSNLFSNVKEDNGHYEFLLLNDEAEHSILKENLPELAVVPEEANSNTDGSVEDFASADEADDIVVPSIQTIEEQQDVRRSSRIKRQPIGLDDYVTNFMTNEDSLEDPVTVSDALGRADGDKWKLAMDEEYAALIENKTWSLVPEESNKKAINSKWVFKTKRDDDGNIVRYKARLVIKGCSQQKGRDYDEIFSP